MARVLKEQRPDTQIVLCEPEEAQLIGSGVEQERHEDGSPSSAHPAFESHPIQGWTPDFIPKLTGDAVAMDLADRVVATKAAEALECSRNLASKEGIFVGISAGATFAGALQVAREAEPGSTLLAMLPDTGERYLSTPLFEHIPVEMTDEELEISRSTPTAQM